MTADALMGGFIYTMVVIFVSLVLLLVITTFGLLGVLVFGGLIGLFLLFTYRIGRKTLWHRHR